MITVLFALRLSRICVGWNFALAIRLDLPGLIEMIFSLKLSTKHEMAPFPRGRAGGRARGVHRGRGRGRGSSVSRGRKSSTYYSTRVEEQVERHVPDHTQLLTVAKLCQRLR